jgi:hypothetical protein
MAEDSTRRLFTVFGMAAADCEDALGERERLIQCCQGRAREALVAAIRARGVA